MSVPMTQPPTKRGRTAGLWLIIAGAAAIVIGLIVAGLTGFLYWYPLAGGVVLIVLGVRGLAGPKQAAAPTPPAPTAWAPAPAAAIPAAPIPWAPAPAAPTTAAPTTAAVNPGVPGSYPGYPGNAGYPGNPPMTYPGYPSNQGL